MKALILALAVVAAAAPALAAGLDDKLIALEKQSWVAWQGHDAAFFQRFLSDDHVEIQPGGPAGKAAVVAGVKAGCQVASYSVDQFKVPSPVWATSLFVRRGGSWLNALYVHTPIPGPSR